MVRGPLSAFDGIKNYSQKNAKLWNNSMLIGLFAGFLVVGNGAEKLVCQHPATKAF